MLSNRPKQNKSKSSSSAPNQDCSPDPIPEELITEILYLLPVKSLLRFNCVSKSWRSLISSPTFIRNHLQKSSGRDDFAHHNLLLTLSSSADFDIRQISVHSLLYETAAATTTTTTNEVNEVGFPIESPDISKVVGACNGLICACFNDIQLFLWNPSTREVKQLPDLIVIRDEDEHEDEDEDEDEDEYEYDDSYSMYGFGYDEINNDYKVVSVVCPTSTHGDEWETVVEVYSLKRNSWRLIGEFECGIPMIGSGQYACGNLHWAAKDDANNQKIVSIHLGNETFGEIEIPNSEGIVTVGVLGQCLSVLYFNHTTFEADVWVMKEYGVQDSWTRVVSVSYFDFSGKHWCGNDLPVCSFRNGQVLIVLSSVLVLYDTKTNTCRWYPQNSEVEDATMFAESLVSPFLYDEEPRQFYKFG